MSISGISDIPKEIIFSDSNYQLINKISPEYFFSDLKIKKKLFNNDVLGDIYLTKSGCLMAELPDHTAISYEFVTPFINEKKFLDITFNDGNNNKENYPGIISSCGGVCKFVNKVDPKYIDETEL